MWIGIAASIFAAGGTWHVQGERIDKFQVSVTDHEMRLRGIEGNDTLKRMIVDLMVEQAKQTTEIKQLRERIQELAAQRRR